MPSYTYIGYAPGSLSIGATFSLSGSYSPYTDRLNFEIDDAASGNTIGFGGNSHIDNGVLFDGDRYADETGDDATQTGSVISFDGTTTIDSGSIYLEQSFTLTKPGGGSISVYQVEIDGTLAGFIVSEQLVEGVNYNYSSSNVQPFNAPTYANLVDVLCFTRNTLIATDTGEVDVQSLQVGDLVQTAYNGLQPIRWIGKTTVSPADLEATQKLRPIKIAKNALGQNLPKRDLIVSRQHRMVISSTIVQRMFGEESVLIGANKLVGLPGIQIDTGTDTVEYFHVLLDNHEVLFAEGAPTESFYTGAQGLSTLGQEAREEIELLYPEIVQPDYRPISALPIPNGKRQKKLIARHKRNRKPLLRGTRETNILAAKRRKLSAKLRDSTIASDSAYIH